MASNEKIVNQRKSKPLTHLQSLKLAKTYVSSFLDKIITQIDKEYELGIEFSLEDKERLQKALSSLKNQNDKVLTYSKEFNVDEDNVATLINKAKEKY